MNARFQILALATVIALAACSKSGGSSGDAAPTETQAGAPVVTIPPGPYTPPTTGVGQNPGSDFAWGGTTPFLFDGVAVYREYTQRNLNNLSELSNVRINLNLIRYGAAYGGTVTIRYNLNGLTYEGFFTSGEDNNANQYNVWFTSSGKKVWHGFFEDFMGAIVVVLDGTTSLGDGLSSTDKVSGSVWFKNYANTSSKHPCTYCWFVKSGPYDCRTWLNLNGVIDPTSAVFPDNGYVRLGTFTDLEITKAFNNELVL